MRPVRLADASAGDRASHPDVGAPVEVRHHPGARRMTLRVSRTRRAVIVTVPVQCALHEAHTFLKRNIDWVRARLDNVPEAEPFADGGSLPLRDVMHKLSLGHRPCGSPGSHRVVERVIDSEGPMLAVSGAIEHGPRRLLDWLMAEARADICRSVDLHAARIGVAAKRIVIRDQSSRWGSCSTTGVLSFSWRLVMAPPDVLDYVAAHEVAHLVEMNHGPRFWALVAETKPDFDRARLWLRMCGAGLHRYGPQRS